MILFPNAKINLGLNIVERRTDGYHNIESVLYPIGWSDILEIIPSETSGATLTVSGNPVACPPEKNLVIKALRAFERHTGVAANVRIFLHKVVPDGAGLGGGSSDAAFTIKGLNELLGTHLSDDEMAAIAATVGADCSFFIYNRPMLATGIGTILRPIDLNLGGLTLGIVKPQESVSTAVAYAGVTPRQAIPPVNVAVKGDMTQWNETLHNDFEENVYRESPAICDVAEGMRQLGPVYSAMSGSGSAIFGIFTDITPERLDTVLSQEFPSLPHYTQWC